MKKMVMYVSLGLVIMSLAIAVDIGILGRSVSAWDDWRNFAHDLIWFIGGGFYFTLESRFK